MEEKIAITGLGYDNQPWVLVDADTGEIAGRDLRVVSAHGEEVMLIGGRPPHKPSSSGKVWISYDQDVEYEYMDGSTEFYPSVFGLRWTHVVSEGEA